MPGRGWTGVTEHSRPLPTCPPARPPNSLSTCFIAFRHIKYLPMGWWWDLLFHPKLMLATLAAVKLFSFTNSVIKL